ncbi:MAG: extracellular solute-binding protein family 3 [Rubritepida sp.]|nr:extracellular solute-binding protein family 3 [Rubritepida sp.]
MNRARFLAGAMLAPLGASGLIGSAQAQTAPAQGDLQRIVAEKLVRVGAVEAFPHYRRDLRTGSWTGIMPEIAELLFTTIGVRCEYVTTEWGTAAAGLQSRRFDIVGGFNATPQRALAVGFSDIVAQSRLALLGLTDKVTGLREWSAVNASSVRIAAVDGASTTRLAQGFLPNAAWTLVRTNDAMTLEMESGRVDVVLSNEPTLSQYRTQRRRGTLVIPTPHRAQPVNFGMRIDSTDLQRWMNVAIEYFRIEGTLDEIWSKYVTPA